MCAAVIDDIEDFPFHLYYDEKAAASDFLEWLCAGFKAAGLELANMRNSFKLFDTRADKRLETEIAGQWFR